jgi:hypothetical protein
VGSPNEVLVLLLVRRRKETLFRVTVTMVALFWSARRISAGELPLQLRNVALTSVKPVVKLLRGWATRWRQGRLESAQTWPSSKQL